jgi:anti-sigma regulatory factor (Ser/Thr protein kinase)
MLRFNPVAELAIPLSLDCLTAVREFVRSHTENTRLDEEQVALLEIAVIESVTNVIRHAKGVPAGDKIMVSVGFDGTIFKCSVSYNGEQYQPSADHAEELPLMDFPEGGFGNFIILNACDAVHFDYVSGRNVVTLEVAQKATL